MANFDEILKNLHGNGIVDPTGEDGTPLEYITVNEKREFIFSENFNKLIAYEGDINSQVISFKLPAIHEGHDLSTCSNKVVRWNNLGSKIEGTSDLKEYNEYWQWEVPPEAFTKGGVLEFAITFYDTENNKIIFSWNTPSCKELKVGETISTVSADVNYPPRNEILIIDDETRSIIAPAGYNYTVCSYGDLNTAYVYFLVKEKIRGIDILNSTIKIRATQGDKQVDTINEEITADSFITATPIKSEKMVLISWKLSNNMTYFTTGVFSVDISFEIADEELKRWSTSTFSKLQIGKSLYVEPGVPQFELPQYVWDGNIQGSTSTPVGGVVKFRSPAEEGIKPEDRELIISGEKVVVGIEGAEEEKKTLASEAFVKNKIADLIGGAPETLDTLKELAEALADNKEFVDALNAAIADKADKAELHNYVKSDATTSGHYCYIRSSGVNKTRQFSQYALDDHIVCRTNTGDILVPNPDNRLATADTVLDFAISKRYADNHYLPLPTTRDTQWRLPSTRTENGVDLFNYIKISSAPGKSTILQTNGSGYCKVNNPANAPDTVADHHLLIANKEYVDTKLTRCPNTSGVYAYVSHNGQDKYRQISGKPYEDAIVVRGKDGCLLLPNIDTPSSLTSIDDTLDIAVSKRYVDRALENAIYLHKFTIRGEDSFYGSFGFEVNVYNTSDTKFESSGGAQDPDKIYDFFNKIKDFTAIGPDGEYQISEITKENNVVNFTLKTVERGERNEQTSSAGEPREVIHVQYWCNDEHDVFGHDIIDNVVSLSDYNF